MSKIVTKIFSARHTVPIWKQRRSLETQIAYYSNYICNNPNWELIDVYFGTSSGVHIHDRPGYQRLMRDCAKKKVDLILVKSRSRFGRDTLETIRQIRRLKKMNVGVYIEIGVSIFFQTDPRKNLFAAFHHFSRKPALSPQLRILFSTVPIAAGSLHKKLAYPA